MAITTRAIRRTAWLINFSGSNVFSFFSRKPASPVRSLVTDMHSHLLPGVDDGVKTPEESFAVIDQLLALGYEKIITTPHIMADYFGNTAASLSTAYESFLPLLRERGYSFPFSLAAEYYLDENMLERVRLKEPLLTLGDRYVLF